MYFNAKQLHSHITSNTRNIPYGFDRICQKAGVNSFTNAPVSERECARILKEVKRHLTTQRTENNVYSLGLSKWLRPWDVIPSLNITPPEGDFGVGIEIEMGFTSANAMREVASHVINMKNVTLDWEGGEFPIEATFPPQLYSKFSAKSQPMRYLKYLSKNKHLVVDIASSPRSRQCVGIHVNVSTANPLPLISLYDWQPLFSTLSREENQKYFGRQPYGYVYSQGHYLEYKLFNSTTCPRKLRQYVEIAVELTKLITSQTVNLHSPDAIELLRVALEKGYKRANKRSANIKC